MTTDAGRDPDICALQLAVQKADSIVAKHREGLALAAQLREQLIRRLIAKQHPQISVRELAQMLRSYGIET